MPGRIHVSAVELPKELRPASKRAAASQRLLEQIAELGLPAPELEVPFTVGRKWRFDFAWPGWLVAIELQGGTWGKVLKASVERGKLILNPLTGLMLYRRLKNGKLIPVRDPGHHTRALGYRDDCEKLRAAQLRGWTVLPLTSSDVVAGVSMGVLRAVGEIIEGTPRRPRQLRLFP